MVSHILTAAPFREKGRQFMACGAQGCEKRGHLDKPYCVDHLLSMPYPASVWATLEADEAERRAGRFSREGVAAQDLRAYAAERLEQGLPLRLRGAAKFMRLTLEHEIEALVRLGERMGFSFGLLRKKKQKKARLAS